MNAPVSRWGERLLRWCVGGLFVAAGVMKIWEPARFADDVARYGLLPNAMINMVALTLPWIEVVAGALLVAGVWKRASTLVIVSLCIIFIIAVGVAMERGLEVCGCFGAALTRRASGWTLVEDAVLLVASLWLWRNSKE